MKPEELPSDKIVRVNTLAVDMEIAREETGWLDISSNLINGWTGNLHVQRLANELVYAVDIDGSSKTDNSFLLLIEGFRVDTSGVILLISGESSWVNTIGTSLASSSTGAVRYTQAFKTLNSFPNSTDNYGWDA